MVSGGSGYVRSSIHLCPQFQQSIWYSTIILPHLCSSFRRRAARPFFLPHCEHLALMGVSTQDSTSFRSFQGLCCNVQATLFIYQTGHNTTYRLLSHLFPHKYQGNQYVYDPQEYARFRYQVVRISLMDGQCIERSHGKHVMTGM